MTDHPKTCYIDSRKLLAAEQLAENLKTALSSYEKKPVFLCIGSDRVTGDSLGPLVGSILQKKLADSFVFGTLTFPVHALNLKEELSYIRKTFPSHPVVAIDASLGSREHQGYITVGQGSLFPGAGVRKHLDAAGDVFITGIVAPAGPFSQLSLQTVRLSRVLFLAELIADAIEKTALP